MNVIDQRCAGVMREGLISKTGDLLYDATANKCELLSRTLLGSLDEYCGNGILSQGFLLEIAPLTENTRGVFKNVTKGQWTYHVIACIEDAEGNWYGCSPANTAKDDSSPAIQVYRAPTYEDLVQAVQMGEVNEGYQVGYEIMEGSEHTY